MERKDPDAMKEPLQFLKKGFRIILPCLFLVALAHTASVIISPTPKPAGVHLVRGWGGLIWWVGAIGIGMVMPWILVMRRQVIEVNGAWPLFASVLIGGFLLRFVLVFGGQGAM
jgi:formate-dependent nitrite reductase membrane component NrfD